MSLRKEIAVFALIFVLIVVAWGLQVVREVFKNSTPSSSRVVVVDFDTCVAAGNPVAESYPRQCVARGKTFTEDIGTSTPPGVSNELEKADLIRLDSPRPGAAITSPLEVTGEARGYWFFEATFPLVLVDWDGRIIAESYAEAQGDPAGGGVNWMTEDFVPFRGTIEFEKPEFIGDFSKRGALILRKDNPSGLPENDDALEIPVLFQ